MRSCPGLTQLLITTTGEEADVAASVEAIATLSGLQALGAGAVPDGTQATDMLRGVWSRAAGEQG